MLRKTICQFGWTIALMVVSFSISADNKVVVIPLQGDTAYQVRSGQILTGGITFQGPVDAGTASIATISFPSPLPVGTPLPTLIDDMTGGCEGPEIAPVGVLCLYQYGFVRNVGNLTLEATANPVPHNRYSPTLYQFDGSQAGSDFYITYTYAYRVP